jgi:hypothetical protein
MEIVCTKKESAQQSSVSEKAAFSIKELSEMTPMSEAFYRAEIIAGRLIAKSFGTRLCVMRDDWLDYLEKQERWAPRKRSKAA